METHNNLETKRFPLIPRGLQGSWMRCTLIIETNNAITRGDFTSPKTSPPTSIIYFAAGALAGTGFFFAAAGAALLVAAGLAAAGFAAGVFVAAGF